MPEEAEGPRRATRVSIWARVAAPSERGTEFAVARRTRFDPCGGWINPNLVADSAGAHTTAMSIFELPHCDGTNDPVVDELHDRAMDEIVAEFTAWRRSAALDTAAAKIDEPPENDETTP
jgi:hypothetical protein